MMPKLTVLMPVYNGEKFLHEAIESILCQTFGDYEFLIIDDGSHDGTEEIVSSYRDKRIRFVQNRKNLGQMETLNLGIGLSNSQYIARMDQDDKAMPERLEKEINILDRFHDISLVYSNSYIIDEKGARRAKTSFDYAKPYRHIVFDKLLKKNFIPGNTVMMRKCIFEKIGLFNPMYQMSAEYELFLRLTQRHKVDFIDEPLGEYRIHRQNSSLDMKKTIEEVIRILACIDRQNLHKRQKAVLDKMVSWWISSLAMCYLFQYNRKLCRAKAIDSLGVTLFNPKAFAAIFMAMFFPKALIDYAGSFRRGWYE